MKDLLKHFKPSSGGNPQNIYKEIIFTPRTKEDDRKAEQMAEIMKYELEQHYARR